MALIDLVQKACARLATKGWAGLFEAHGLDIRSAKLAEALAEPLSIRRTIPGFEDFALEGTRGIEPGAPARSLLYHAFASPNVLVDAAGKPLRDFPTAAEIEAVESYVFAAQAPSLQELRVLAGNHNLALAVFALEYRPAHETVHRMHADLCFARTGIARVGTTAAFYDRRRRGFLPFVDGDKPSDIRVLPARYAAFIAVQRRGASSHGPLNPREGDADLDFWVPLHKLFSGSECLRDQALTVELDVNHVNEKLRRIHVATNGAWGWSGDDIEKPPFRVTDGLAELSVDPAHATGTVIPAPHPLVEEARHKGKVVTFDVPLQASALSSSLYLAPHGRHRPAPEFIHARHVVKANGTVKNLNDERDVVAAVERGGYAAKHYVDYTADGWVEALCPEIAADVPRRVPAYSLITPPDFFVNTDQRELLEWAKQSVRTALRETIWVVPPETLNDRRFPPNLTLTDHFVKEDQTVTAIVAMPPKGNVEPTRAHLANSDRHAHLPDAAAGVFDPGWDVSIDVTQGTPHLAMYGLGSPFPEDAKLCAALSTFWPAVAPDTARVFQPNAIGDTSPTVAPLSDEEIGIGGRAWDGVAPPKVGSVDGTPVVEYTEYDHTDYVEAALDGRFSLQATGAIDSREYESRVLAMAMVYRALGITSDNADTQLRQKARWSVLSFRVLAKKTAEVKQAEKEADQSLVPEIYRFELYRHGKRIDHPTDPRKIRVVIRERALAFVDGLNVLLKVGASEWQSRGDA